MEFFAIIYHFTGLLQNFYTVVEVAELNTGGKSSHVGSLPTLPHLITPSRLFTLDLLSKASVHQKKENHSDVVL